MTKANANSIEIAYETFGRADDPCLVLINWPICLPSSARIINIPV